MRSRLTQLVINHLENIYNAELQNPVAGKYYDAPIDTHSLAQELIALMRLSENLPEPELYKNNWDQQDVIAITYADSLIKKDEHPLHTLKTFIDEQSSGVINGVHLLPFFPFTSDDGFAVSDYDQVRSDLGDWDDIADLASNYRIMGDLVINHCSASHHWFDNFLAGKSPGNDFFFTAQPDQDLSEVTRPRTSPLLKAVQTTSGEKHVWCTFGHDQVDLNFQNTEVLKAFVKIVRNYLDKGISIFRLDAVAFLWKIPGTNCLNLPQTHEIVRLLRTLIQYAHSNAIIITETNIPNIENLSYFGNANEAHCIYNFSLPPLLLYTVIFGNSHYLKLWMMSMPPARNGTTYFNFIASHDGIGLRPTQGLLAESEVDSLIAAMENFGGKVSYRALDDGKNQPYEINIALFDAMLGTVEGRDDYQVDRFVCIHAIMLALEGIPGIYIHSLLGTHNDYAKFERTGQNRALNRHQWDYDELLASLTDSESTHHQVFERLKKLLAIRIQQPAFHPNATQFTLHLGDHLFGFWRQSNDRLQSIFSISNITNREQELPISQVNLVLTDDWVDLISGKPLTDTSATIVMAPYQTLWISNSITDQ